MADLRWSPGELFDVKAGLLWQLGGERVEAIGAHRVAANKREPR
jgi:hypothetical protein